MKRYDLARKKWPLLLCLAACAGLELLLYLTITRHAVEAARVGRPLEGEWGWVAILGWHIAIALAGAALGWQPFAELRTIFTAEGIKRPRLFKPPVFVAWAEAESVFIAPLMDRPYLVKINAPGRSIEINALYYKEPEKLLSLVEESMRGYAETSTCPKLAAH
jgi:hypothetical protein